MTDMYEGTQINVIFLFRLGGDVVVFWWFKLTGVWRIIAPFLAKYLESLLL